MTHLVMMAAAAFGLVIALAGPASAQQPAGPWPLVDIRVDGLVRYSVADVVRLSGLEPGAPITLDLVQQAANQLMRTGLFRNLGFSYNTTTQGMTLTLKVQEPAWTVPVVFDNIIWMSDAEFGAELAKRVPGFAGMAVEGGQANDFIAAAAERVLADRGITGRVEILPRMEVRTGATTYALAVRDTGTSLRVCALHLPGAGVISERTLLGLGTGFTNRDYSKASLTAFSQGTLQQVYRERGHWAARFDPPVASPVTGECNGLNVSIAVTEGPAYKFGDARWAGAASLDPTALERALDLRIGSTADIRRLEDGLRAVERLYHQQGYLTVSHVARPEFDDAAQRVTFTIEIKEGPQFRMGTISTSGLTDRQTRDITGRWRLKAGEVFDGVYYREFISRETQRLGGAMKGDATLNEQAVTVNVTLTGF